MNIRCVPPCSPNDAIPVALAPCVCPGGASGEPPAIETLLPADGAVGVAVASNIAITFDQDIQAGAGDVRLYATVGDVLVETFPASAGAIVGPTATFNPAVNLTAATAYYVQVDSDAFEGLGGANFAGISDETTWNFTTA